MAAVIGDQSDRLEFQGASGKVTFDANADRVASTDIFQAQVFGNSISEYFLIFLYAYN